MLTFLDISFLRGHEVLLPTVLLTKKMRVLGYTVIRSGTWIFGLFTTGTLGQRQKKRRRKKGCTPAHLHTYYSSYMELEEPGLLLGPLALQTPEPYQRLARLSD